jgi:hypothetical protein
LIQLPELRQVFQFLSLIHNPPDFDLGGILAVGIFLMSWNTETCFKKFYSIAEQTFGRDRLPSHLHKAQKLLLLCFGQTLYSDAALKNEFQLTFGPLPRMFNLQSTDIKVAVIAAPVEERDTSIICNYSGEGRPRGKGYQIIQNITVREAIRSTSAAPG